MSTRIPQPTTHKMAELQHSQEFMKEIQAAKMRETRMITGDLKVSG